MILFTGGIKIPAHYKCPIIKWFVNQDNIQLTEKSGRYLNGDLNNGQLMFNVYYLQKIRCYLYRSINGVKYEEEGSFLCALLTLSAQP